MIHLQLNNWCHVQLLDLLLSLADRAVRETRVIIIELVRLVIFPFLLLNARIRSKIRNGGVIAPCLVGRGRREVIRLKGFVDDGCFDGPLVLGIRTDLLPYRGVRADMHLLALLRVDHGPYSIVAVRFVEAVLRGYDEHLLIIR